MIILEWLESGFGFLAFGAILALAGAVVAFTDLPRKLIVYGGCIVLYGVCECAIAASRISTFLLNAALWCGGIVGFFLIGGIAGFIIRGIIELIKLI